MEGRILNAPLEQLREFNKLRQLRTCNAVLRIIAKLKRRVLARRGRSIRTERSESTKLTAAVADVEGVCMAVVSALGDGGATEVCPSELENSPTGIPARYCFDEKDVVATGAFGSVYIAGDLEGPTSSVAIKKITLTGKSQKEADKLRGEAGEAALLKSLNHPHIIKCFDSFEANDGLYVVMELAQGCVKFVNFFAELKLSC